MPSRRELERYADRCAREIAALEARASVLREREKALRDILATEEVLHKRLRPSIVNEPNMEKSHRLAISEGHGRRDDSFRVAIRKAGFSQNQLAKRVGLNQAVLSLHRRELRRIKRSKAEAIERLTGWPADGKHWPCGIVSDGE